MLKAGYVGIFLGLGHNIVTSAIATSFYLDEMFWSVFFGNLLVISGWLSITAQYYNKSPSLLMGLFIICTGFILMYLTKDLGTFFPCFGGSIWLYCYFTYKGPVCNKGFRKQEGNVELFIICIGIIGFIIVFTQTDFITVLLSFGYGTLALDSPNIQQMHEQHYVIWLLLSLIVIILLGIDLYKARRIIDTPKLQPIREITYFLLVLLFVSFGCIIYLIYNPRII